MNQTESRKHEHVKIALEKNVSSSHNYWDDIFLSHNALPELNKEKVDLTTTVFGKKIGMPIVISGMTGGYEKAEKINENLAVAAEKFRIPMGLGSQRAALENQELKKTYNVVKNFDIPIVFGNIGASQIVEWGHEKTLEYSNQMVDMVDADVLMVCLNFLQEVIQLEGEADAEGCFEAIKNLAEDFDKPVMIKESGAGISFDVAKRLSETKISGIDIGGLGGTSFAAIEHYRAKMNDDDLHARGGRTFWNWGIPTPASLLETGKATDWKLPVFATGGIRNGLDAAKAMVLGADAAGVAQAILGPAHKGKKETIFEIDAFYKELRAAMFLVGAENVKKLRDTDYIFKGADLWI